MLVLVITPEIKHNADKLEEEEREDEEERAKSVADVLLGSNTGLSETGSKNGTLPPIGSSKKPRTLAEIARNESLPDAGDLGMPFPQLPPKFKASGEVKAEEEKEEGCVWE